MNEDACCTKESIVNGALLNEGLLKGNIEGGPMKFGKYPVEKKNTVHDKKNTKLSSPFLQSKECCGKRTQGEEYILNFKLFSAV